MPSTEITREQALYGDRPINSPATPLRVRVLRSVAEVEEVRDSWMQLQHHPNSDIDFYLTVVRSMPDVLRPHVLILYRGATATAILVGRVENGRVDLRIGYAGFLAPRCRVITFIYGGLLGDPSREECEALVHEVMKSLRQGEADIAFFNHPKADSPLYRAVRQYPGYFSRDHFPSTQPHRIMKLPKSVEELQQSLPRKVRKNQRWNKLLRDYAGQLTIKCFHRVSELEEMAQAVESVAKKTYHRGLGIGFVDNIETRQRLQLVAQKGWLRTYVLYVGNRPWAFWMGELYQGTFHSGHMGYDPDFSQYSPGMYLIMKVVEGLYHPESAGQVSEIDFGQGDGEWKTHLANCEWTEGPVYIFAPTLRGLRLNAVRTPIVLADRIGRQALGTRLLARVKKLWRSRVAYKGHPESELGATSQPAPHPAGEPVSAE